MSAYPTHILACDNCGKVFADPLAKRAKAVREQAKSKGWFFCYAPLAKDDVVPGNNKDRDKYQRPVDLCPTCAETQKDGKLLRYVPKWLVDTVMREVRSCRSC